MVYVDNDPTVVAHNRALRSMIGDVISVGADMREPATVLEDSRVRELLNFERPIGLLFGAVLHFARRGIGTEIVRQFRRVLPSGSYVAISVLCADGMTSEVIGRLEDVFSYTSVPLVIRSTGEVEHLFDGMTIIEPGLVDVTQYTAHKSLLSLRILGGIGAVAET